ncbi:hypothetical protein GCM10009037_07100 [Halarchaeum grantii]|uniref:Uncharacterized protein n=1 Tax=Halarchaeum grantii TaxID=1193105 RepID=A0A830EZS2_9EURY|nr:hypothetical protein [Halarchaeum grantii]GGL26036.1 hypothetical protein GCM10009037_07100 [Halarchaeum grantii]
MKLNIGGGRGFGLFLAALMVLSVGVGAVSAANSAVNYDADATQSQHYRGDVTIATYQMDWSGLQYEDDSGEVVEFPGSVNESADNPYSYLPTRAVVSDFGAFPHAKENVSALEASEWSTSGASVTNTQPASDVDAVEMSLASGDSATYSNFSITSDEAKKTLFAAFDVNSLSSDATVELRVNDTDGDMKVAEINASRSSGEDWMAGETGDGFVFQRQLGQMDTVTASGSDGTFDDIESVEVVATSGSADITWTGLNLDKTGTYVLGERLADTDDDDELETETITEHKTPGAISVTSLDTLGDVFGDATLHGLTVDFVQSAESLPSADVNVTFSNAESYPSFDVTVDLYYRMSLRSAYDLGYSNLDLVAEQALPESRYQTAEYAEGAGDVDFTDASYASISSLGNAGDTVVIDSTIQPGQTSDVHWRYLVTSSEKSGIQSVGGIMGPTGGSGGIVSFLISLPGMAVSALLGLLGVRWARG